LRAAWATEFPARYCASAFPLFLGRRLTVLDLPARDIDNELGRLAEIARAFGGLCH
jgi:hypothetical protein